MDMNSPTPPPPRRRWAAPVGLAAAGLTAGVLLAGTTGAFAAEPAPSPGSASSTATDGSTPDKPCHGESGSTDGSTGGSTAPSAPQTSSDGAVTNT